MTASGEFVVTAAKNSFFFSQNVCTAVYKQGLSQDKERGMTAGRRGGKRAGESDKR